GSICMPLLRALWPSWTANGAAKGSVSLASRATRRTDGSSSRISSSLLPAVSTAAPDTPVMFSARPGEAGAEAGRDRLPGGRHQDGNVARRMPRRLDGWCQRGDNQIDLEANQLCGLLREKSVIAFG